MNIILPADKFNLQNWEGTWWWFISNVWEKWTIKFFPHTMDYLEAIELNDLKDLGNYLDFFHDLYSLHYLMFLFKLFHTHNSLLHVLKNIRNLLVFYFQRMQRWCTDLKWANGSIPTTSMELTYFKPVFHFHTSENLWVSGVFRRY